MLRRQIVRSASLVADRVGLLLGAADTARGSLLLAVAIDALPQNCPQFRHFAGLNRFFFLLLPSLQLLSSILRQLRRRRRRRLGLSSIFFVFLLLLSFVGGLCILEIGFRQRLGNQWSKLTVLTNFLGTDGKPARNFIEITETR